MVQYSKHQWSIQYVRKPLAHSTRSTRAFSAAIESLQRDQLEPLAHPSKASHELSLGASITKDLFVGFIE